MVGEGSISAIEAMRVHFLSVSLRRHHTRWAIGRAGRWQEHALLWPMHPFVFEHMGQVACGNSGLILIDDRCPSERTGAVRGLTVGPRSRYLKKGSGRKSVSITKEDRIMNKEQIAGTSKDVAGKIQQQAGKIIGSKEQQAKGLMHQVEGKSEKALGDAKETLKDAIDKA
jgi:uncharacterized protein YjbJ (UPF0337 family)